MASVIITAGMTLEQVKASIITCSECLTAYARADGQIDVHSSDVPAVESWYGIIAGGEGIKATLVRHILYPRCIQAPSEEISEERALRPAAIGRSWFKASEVAAIYGFPAPIATQYTVGVISFGGGLYGTVGPDGVLTGGDVQAYWTYLGIPTNSQPRVVIVTIDGATNAPNVNDGGSTAENTLDVETIGGACPSPNLTIILYIAPNTLSQLSSLLTYIYNTNVTVGGVNYKPNLISCSWGAPEIYYAGSLATSVNSIMSTLTSAGISICTATGDNGSTNGVPGGGNYVDFPSSSPFATAVGGTTLVCPNNVYDGSTTETAWTSGGGGVSALFSKPAYQAAVPGTYRAIPDLAAIADPNTGVVYIVNSSYYIYGGTSVAAPVVGAFLASLNCRTFANPLLYQAPSNSFHDVLAGSNGGFSAGTGFDNCTGLGSINGANLAAYITSVIVTGVGLSQSTATLLVGATQQLTATVVPLNATNKAVTWTSSSPGVATVSTSGLLTGISAGSTTIIVTTADGNKTATCAATVTGIVNVTGVSLNRTSASLSPGGTLQLLASVTPTNATNTAVAWTTSNGSVATVNGSGLVTAVANGSCTITVTTASGSRTATCALTVVTVVSVTGVSLNQSSASLVTGATAQLVATVAPVGATVQTVAWTSSNLAVATVSESGLVTAVAAGSATITVTTGDGGFTATCLVAVYVPPLVPVTGVVVAPTTATIVPSGTVQLTATVSPAGASNKTLTWSSNSPNATVNQSGLVRGISAGAATVSATTTDGGKVASCIVTVTGPVIILLNPSTFTTTVGSTTNVNASVNRPGLAANAVSWSSANPSVAAVPGTGSVKGGNGSTTTIGVGVIGVGNGTTTITCTGFGVTVTATVTVTTSVSSVSLNVTNLRMAVGSTFLAVATVAPAGASNKAVTWTSSVPSVATVGVGGLVRAIGNGSTSIRATTVEGGKSAAAVISVATPVTGVSLNVSSLRINRGGSRALLANVAPANASNISVRWSSTNSRVASVTGSGVVRGVGSGTATVRATTVDGGFVASCVVTVV
jgi:uncharacterized protein YjdB